MNQLKTIAGDILLHEFLEKKTYLHIENRVADLLYNQYAEIFKKSKGDLLKIKFDFLKLSNETHDYFDLIILDSFLEFAFIHHILDENLVDNKRIPKGIDYQYGNYFEKKIVSIISNYAKVESTQFKRTDAIIVHPSTKERYIVEIKCSNQNTEQQVEKYQASTGIENFITVNGHDNAIRINELSIFRVATGYFNKELLMTNRELV
jgi:hypothetical protein